MQRDLRFGGLRASKF